MLPGESAQLCVPITNTSHPATSQTFAQTVKRTIYWVVMILGLALAFTLIGPHERPAPEPTRPSEYDGTHP